MKTEQTLMNVLCVLCVALVLTALVVLVSSQVAPAGMLPGPIPTLPAVNVVG